MHGLRKTNAGIAAPTKAGISLRTLWRDIPAAPCRRQNIAFCHRHVCVDSLDGGIDEWLTFGRRFQSVELPSLSRTRRQVFQKVPRHQHSQVDGGATTFTKPVVTIGIRHVVERLA